jgi:hypothetical protein
MSQGNDSQGKQAPQRAYALSKKGYEQVLEDFEVRHRRVQAEHMLARIRLAEAEETAETGIATGPHLAGLSGLALQTWIRNQSYRVMQYSAEENELESKISRLKSYIAHMK